MVDNKTTGNILKTFYIRRDSVNVTELTQKLFPGMDGAKKLLQINRKIKRMQNAQGGAGEHHPPSRRSILRQAAKERSKKDRQNFVKLVMLKKGIGGNIDIIV